MHPPQKSCLGSAGDGAMVELEFFALRCSMTRERGIKSEERGGKKKREKRRQMLSQTISA